jgi:Spy/CpxP family protein refolding chaperone
MARHITWVVALVLTCVPLTASTGQDRGQQRSDKPQTSGKDNKDKPQAASNEPNERERWKWWLYDRAELGITDQQSRDINQIWEANFPKLRETRQEMERAEDELSKTIKEHKADIATISLMIDRVESARSQHAKMRILMLYRIDQLLSAEQRAKVQALRARQEAARKDRQPQQGHRRRP